MMRSLSSAVAGLRTHQTKMDVIGNNIANVNTYGFKASRVTFADVYYQNLSRGSGATDVRGGTNPTQIGYGSAVATIDVLNTQSGAASTDRAMDVYITGEGFLVSQDANGNLMYTRLGNLGFDAEGNLINGNGDFMMGFPMRYNPETGMDEPLIGSDGTVAGDALMPIQVSPELLDELTGISIGLGGEIVGILPGDTRVTLGTSLPDWITSAIISPESDLIGAVELKAGGMFDATATTALDTLLGGVGVSRVDFGDKVFNPNSPVSITFSGSTLKITGQAIQSDGSIVTVTASGKYDNGKFVLRSGSTDYFTIYVDDAPTGAGGTNSAVNLTGQYMIRTKDQGGNVVRFPETAGDYADWPPTGNSITLGDMTINLDTASMLATDPKSYFCGNIGRVTLSEGDKINIGCIALANFRNSAALEQIGDSQYAESLNSGEPTFARPGTNNMGSLKANYLEMSNVDISKEFTDMITTQRGFQANTRIVTVSDEMLQELVNLKR